MSCYYIIVPREHKQNNLKALDKYTLGRKEKFNMMTVRNMVSPRTDREVANQFIIEGDGKTIFQSYNSTIAVIDWNEHTVKIGEDWNYSNTTGKYRNAFFHDNDFSDMADTTRIRKVMKKVDEDGFALIIMNDYTHDDTLFTVTRI